MSKPSIPSGKTWFDTHKVHFQHVPISADKGISTDEFLDAAESTTSLFEVLGSSIIFGRVKADMITNITKVRERRRTSPASSATLQSLCKTELDFKSHIATEGLLWLVRGLDFITQALTAELTDNASVAPTEPKPKKELTESWKTSYQTTLAPFHNWLQRALFNWAVKFAQPRKDFYLKLAGPGTEPEAVRQALKTWILALEQRVKILKAFVENKEARW
ncbi:hypothetical protein LTR80_011754 [Exophiala xenobiotica]